MTYDELLAKVNKDIEDDEWYDKTAVFNFAQYAKTLRAVLELHKPDVDGRCLQCECHLPCPTIQAIEKELG
jgi:hypothetical protein